MDNGGYLQFWSRGQPIGVPFLTCHGNIWKLIKRRNGSLISINGDGTIRFYPEVGHAIRIV